MPATGMPGRTDRHLDPHLGGDELVREYGRLRRRRSRLLQRLRDRLADSPLSQASFRAALLLRDRDLCRLHPEGHA